MIWKPAVAALAAATLLSCSDEPTAPTEARPTTEIPAALTGTWTHLPDYPVDVFAPTSASLTNPTTRRTRNYVIGGRNRLPGAGHITDAVRVFDVSARTWRKVAPLPVPLTLSNGAVEIGGKIYVSGGFTRVRVGDQWRTSVLRRLYVYDPAANRWTRKRDMPIITARGFSDAFQGRLYVAASCDDLAYCGELGRGALWRYNPGTDRWTLLGLTPHNPPGPGGGFIGGKLYLVSEVGHLEIFDPATREWSSGPAPFQQFCLFPGFTLQAKLYVITCSTEGATLVFDPKVGTWTKAAERPSDTWGAVSQIFVNGKPRAQMVGGTRPGNDWLFTP